MEAITTGCSKAAKDDMPRVYHVEDIAGILGISRASAYKLIAEGLFHTVRIGTSIRISKKSFDEWLDR